MPSTVVRLDELGPRRDYLRAMQVICPPHPDDSKLELRIGYGFRKRGQYNWFVRKLGQVGPDSWVEHSPCTDAEMDAIFLLYGMSREECQLEHRPGPSGWGMLYHVDEPP